ncbi:protein phosphatase 1 regulatory subunit 26 isoform X2 [Hemiscyllium ocellatum]|nr:protein phosphatase 1 regulatory subunit 26 isoform X2 [Hemiscyllium ocellatum]XP_060697638.1 protein phosphatase 1 regulatory subunit 26 isoform X2 [Hemiscyllium ocellatum]XP_060697639.1 protein phosphatase 1 regulatory subunit 26 isoform X2 [Hemiscyllium ocellatum]XP_060697640.1 protein phosphatase 1 regulatory subunit 26 isoform X2 [Hemiscyllium ocellatum]
MMFFTGLPPVSVVQTDWHPFGASRNFSLPVSFSDSGEEFSLQSAVSVDVKMIIENLQATDSACAMNSEPSSQAQTNTAPKRRSEGMLDRSSIRILKGAAVEELKPAYPSCTLDTEESNLGRCTLDSDSDESVDRDIEEAIQEYLKKKTENPSFTSKASGTNVLPGTHTAIENSAAKISNGISQGNEGVNPPKIANIVSREPAESRCSSPCSISSNDSFELSIQAEIERFLQEKRNRETGNNSSPKSEAVSVGRTEQKENLVKVGQKKRKRCIKSSAGTQRNPVPQPVINTNSQVGNTKSSQFRKSEAVCSSEKGSEGNPKSYKNVASRKKARSRHRFKELHKSSNTQWGLSAEFTESKVNPVNAQVELSDSSSDDGIEEAIQLYQLEQKKGKTKDVAFVLGLLPHKSPQKYADMTSPMRSREKERLQTAMSKRNCIPKPGRPCPANLSDTDTSDSDDCLIQTERNTTDSRLGWKETFQSETLSESSPKWERSLMTKVQSPADSILGGAPSEKGEHAGKGKTSCEYTNVASKQVTLSSDSESSSADSSDSIEKEIQNYLALKASQSSQKSSKVRTESDLDRNFSQEPKIEDNLNTSPSLFISLSSSSSQTSLLQKKRLKNNVGSGHKLEKEKLRESQPHESSVEALVLTNNSTVTSKINLKGSSSGQTIPDMSNIWYSMTLSQNQEKLSPKDRVGEKQSTVKAVHDSWQTDEKSSSLDSDEDLDRATKDLLQTRKKLGKRSRDMKNRCKKRVRFTGAEVLTYSEQSTGIGDKTLWTTGEGYTVSHGPLKSCLSKSNKSACRRYLDSKSKGNKKTEEHSDCEGNSKMTSIRNLKVGLSCGTAFSTADGQTWKNITIENSSSADSDDGIEQEILKFLAEKARANSRLNEPTDDPNTVHGFKRQEEENKRSEMTDLDRTLSTLPQQAEGSHRVHMKGPCRLEDEPTAGYFQREVERAGTESKTNINQQDLLQNIYGTCRAQCQNEDKYTLGEPPATSKTETKAGIVPGSLQVDNIVCPGKGVCRSDVLEDKKMTTSLENIQRKTTQSLASEQSVPYVNSKLLLTGQSKPQAGQIRSPKQTVNKLWNTFQTDCLSDTESVSQENGTCRRGQYSRDNRSGLGRGTNQSSQAVVNTLSHVGWAGRAKMKSEKDKNQGQPLASLLPSVGAQCSEVSQLPSIVGQEQSDHNYQSGMKSEERDYSDATCTHSNCETLYLCEMSGACSCLPIGEPTVASAHKEGSSVEQRVDSIEAASATETLIAEEASKGEASSKCKSGGTGVTLLSIQCQPLSQTSSGSKIEEQNDKGSRAEEAAQGNSPEAFYDRASDHSDDDSRVDTDRSGLQRQGAEV